MREETRLQTQGLTRLAAEARLEQGEAVAEAGIASGSGETTEGSGGYRGRRRRNSATVTAVATAALRDSEPGSSAG